MAHAMNLSFGVCITFSITSDINWNFQNLHSVKQNEPCYTGAIELSSVKCGYSVVFKMAEERLRFTHIPFDRLAFIAEAGTGDTM